MTSFFLRTLAVLMLGSLLLPVRLNAQKEVDDLKIKGSSYKVRDLALNWLASKSKNLQI